MTRTRPVIVIAGQVERILPSLAGTTTTSLSLAELAGSAGAALADPARWLTRAGAWAAAQLEA